MSLRDVLYVNVSMAIDGTIALYSIKVNNGIVPA